VEQVFIVRICHEGGRNPRVASVHKTREGAEKKAIESARALGLIETEEEARTNTFFATGLIAEKGHSIVTVQCYSLNE
jgi:hypothetical protein